MNECTSFTCHFHGHADKLKQYGGHCLMQHDQGFSISHWTLPSGDYSLRIAPADTRATFNKKTMQNVPTLLAVLMAIGMRQFDTACIARCWMSFVAFVKATKRHNPASTRSDRINWTCQRQLFLTFNREIGLKLTCWPLITIGV